SCASTRRSPGRNCPPRMAARSASRADVAPDLAPGASAVFPPEAVFPPTALRDGFSAGAAARRGRPGRAAASSGLGGMTLRPGSLGCVPPGQRSTIVSQIVDNLRRRVEEVPMPDRSMLVLTAHPGDYVWRAGGAIALAVSRGERVVVGCMSFGERGESA